MFSRARSIAGSDGAATDAAWMETAGMGDAGSCDAAARVDVVERLAIVGEPWCTDVLRAALRGERTSAVRKAIEKALKEGP